MGDLKQALAGGALHFQFEVEAFAGIAIKPAALEGGIAPRNRTTT